MLKKAYSKSNSICKVTFTLPLDAVQGGTDVRILGEFNDWNWERGYRMKAGKADFSTEVELETGRDYQFRYLIDNHIWENDWNADNYLSTPFAVYNSVVSLAAAATNGAAKVETVVAAKPAFASKSAAAAPKSQVSEAKPAATKVAEKVVAKVAAPKVAAAPKAAAKTAADDLTKIEGIGPKISELLKNAGITTFEALAKSKVATLKSILEAAGPRYQIHNPSTWAEQSALAAKGDWAKLEKLQVELNAGKR